MHKLGIENPQRGNASTEENERLKGMRQRKQPLGGREFEPLELMQRFTCTTQTVPLLYNGRNIALATSKALRDPQKWYQHLHRTLCASYGCWKENSVDHQSTYGLCYSYNTVQVKSKSNTLYPEAQNLYELSYCLKNIPTNKRFFFC